MRKREAIARKRAVAGRLGGKAAAAALTPEQRRDRARKAVAAREVRRGRPPKG